MNANDRSLVGFAMLAHALFHAYELSIPILVVVWLDTFAASEAVLGTVVGAGYALVGVGALPSGILADKYGSKSIVVASILGMGVGFGVMSFAPNVIVLAVALLLWGVAASVYHPAGLSLLSRGAEQRGSAFAIHGAAGNVGTVVGPLAAALLLVAFDWRVVTALFFLPALAGAALATRLEFDETAGVEDPTTAADGGISSVSELRANSSMLFSGGFVVVFAIVILYGVYYRGILTFLPNILASLPLFEPITAFGRTFAPGQYVYSGLLLVGVIGQYAGGKLTDVVDTELALAGSLAALVVGALLFVPASRAGIEPLLGVCVLLGFFIYVTAPVYQATVADTVTADVHGLTFGYTYLAMFGIGAAGAAVAGVALTYSSVSTLFVVLAGVALLAVVLTVSLVRR